LGEAVFDHVYLVITQANTLIHEKREQAYNNFKNELPRLVMQHHRPLISDDKILFADFDRFDEYFINPLTKVVQTATLYEPNIPKGIDPNDPESIEKLLATPAMQKVMEKQEKILEEHKKQAE